MCPSWIAIPTSTESTLLEADFTFVVRSAAAPSV
jgi:hypothetical protein